MTKNRELDCFYTKPKVAEDCMGKLFSVLNKFMQNPKNNSLYNLWPSSFDGWIEPAAGEGVFLDLFPINVGTKIGFDINKSNHSNIFRTDFLKISILPESHRAYNNIIVVSNPPFGKNASMAVRFFNHSAKFANCIAMILPRTFKKNSIQNRLDLNFHCISSTKISKNAFTFEGKDYDVPCVFQIWVKKDRKRKIIQEPMTHYDFSFVSPSYCNVNKFADFAIQRVGVNAGKVKDITNDLGRESHYFIKSETRLSSVREVFSRINWNSVKNSTVGNPSIAKTEIVKLYEKEKRNGMDKSI